MWRGVNFAKEEKSKFVDYFPEYQNPFPSCDGEAPRICSGNLEMHADFLVFL